MANKLTSPVTFSPIDYPKLPICKSDEPDFSSISLSTNDTNKWNHALLALHGDSFHPIPSISINFGYDMYCAIACDVVVQPTWNDTILKGYSYNLYLDGLPAIYTSETEYVSYRRVCFFLMATLRID